MTPLSIINNLLRFVKVENGIVVVQVSSSKWIPVIDYGERCRPVAIRFLSFVDAQMQTVKLHQYLYDNFYILGRDSMFATPAEPPIVPTNIPTISLEDRPARFNSAFYKTELTTGHAILTQNTSLFSVKTGEWVKSSMEIDGLAVVDIVTRDARTNAREDTNSWFVSDSQTYGFDAEDKLIRFYFNSVMECTSLIAHSLIKSLDYYGIQFQLKYLVNESDRDRCDKIVMYVPQRQFIIAARITLGVYGRFKEYFIHKLPLFVKEIYPGVGFAEEPVTSESFGRSRCLWIASAVMRWASTLSPSITTATPSAEQICQIIREEQKLVTLNEFYLNPGSKYPYNLGVFNCTSHFIGCYGDLNCYLRNAIEIGNFICREAIWNKEGKVSWISAQADQEDNPFYTMMGDGWERGIVGPLLFLHVLFKYTADPLYQYVVDSAVINLSEIFESSTFNRKLLELYKYSPAVNRAYGPYQDDVDPVSVSSKTIVDTKKRSGLELFKVGTPQQSIFSIIVKILHENATCNDSDWTQLSELLLDVSTQPNLFLTNEFGWDDLLPGMNGLSLLGFSNLLVFDRELPPIPLGDLYKES